MLGEIILSATLALTPGAAAGVTLQARRGQLPYLDSSLSPSERAADLLGRMTWEERVGQLGGIRRAMSRVNGQPSFNRTSFEEIRESQNGNIGLGVQFNYAENVLPVVNQLRAEQINNTRLGIPYITIADSVNGIWVSGGTLFPGTITMSCSWNLDLFEQAIAAIRDENLALGITWALSPEVDIARDPRNGRNNEMYGEDVYLTSEYGLRYIKTMQEKDEDGFVKVATTIKHFVYGQGSGGVNRASMAGGINHIMNDLGIPYIKAIREADPLSVMVSYSSVDGVPMSFNKYMVQDVLRGIMGFKGLVMSDANSVEYLYTESKVASSREDAATKALRAGLNHELSPAGAGFFTTLIDAIDDGEIAGLISESVRAILEIKFATGAFDKPLPSVEGMRKTLRNERHLEINRNMTRESIVLLQNDGLLPLDRSTIGKVAVIGVYADMVNAGMYAACNATDPAYGDSLRRSLEKVLGEENVLYEPGVTSYLPNNDTSGIEPAVAAAKEAGLAVVVLGSGWGTFDPATFNNERTDGEGYAHADLGFPGLQQELLDAVLDAGVPTVLVLNGGQVFVLNESTKRSGAIIHTFLSGEFTGDALVEILFGDVNPSGKLTMSMPEANGQFPVAYDYLASDDAGGFGPANLYDWHWPQGSRYVPMRFGFGLSYTTFEVAPPTVDVGRKNVSVTVAVQNKGSMGGKEVVQLYYRPDYSIIEFPVMRLIRFQKVEVSAGESKGVTLTVPYEELGYYVNGKWHSQGGNYTFWVGNSSRDEDLQRLNDTLAF
ncbi:hypothetical protein DL767_001790 [Monosporascus sp. MG133]|nr:hypothetical protein DL767_001790 [Monosporascus sp. MG133]